MKVIDALAILALISYHLPIYCVVKKISPAKQGMDSECLVNDIKLVNTPLPLRAPGALTSIQHRRGKYRTKKQRL